MLDFLRWIPVLLLLANAATAQAPAPQAPLAHLPVPPSRVGVVLPLCLAWDTTAARRNPTAAELRCRHQITGPGRFGLLSYQDIPVYQPATPLPGTHVVTVPGMPRPAIGESYEAWEWRTLRTRFGPEASRVERGLATLDPFFATRLLHLENRLREEGIRAARQETWRSPERQAFLFQQGRSRPGPLATATLTSWHSLVDARGVPAGRAADYSVAAAHLPRFHEIAADVGLHSFGADSNDPGHVFLPPTESVPTAEIVLLRLLPRVPHVTLATGRPDGEWVPHGRIPELRQASQQFAEEAFLRAPDGRLAGTGIIELPWTAWAIPWAPPPDLTVRPPKDCGLLQRLIWPRWCST